MVTLTYGLLILASAMGSLQTSSERTVVTVGYAEATVPTDYITLTIAVLVRNRSPVLAADTVMMRLAALADTLAVYQREGDSLIDRAFRVDPDLAFGNAGQQITGYMARGSYTLRSRHLGLVRGLITACLNGGATEIRHMRPGSDAFDRERTVLLMAAVEAARRRADALALAAGGQIDGLVALETDDVDSWQWLNVQSFAFLEQAQTIEVAPPSLTVRSTVKSTWSFRPTPR